VAYGKILTNKIKNNKQEYFHQNSSTVLGKDGLVWIAFAP
jgi:hypothetical protein